MSEERYTPEFAPCYRVRNESYENGKGEFVPRYHLERVTATGRQSWGITTYTNEYIADMMAAALNTAVLHEARG